MSVPKRRADYRLPGNSCSADDARGVRRASQTFEIDRKVLMGPDQPQGLFRVDIMQAPFNKIIQNLNSFGNFNFCVS